MGKDLVRIFGGRVGQVVVVKRSPNAYVIGEYFRDREKAVVMAKWSLRKAWLYVIDFCLGYEFFLNL